MDFIGDAHQIKMRVWRQSSETRQAALDAKKQAIRDEVVFGKGLDAPVESEAEGSRVGAVGTLALKQGDVMCLSRGDAVQRVAARYEANGS